MLVQISCTASESLPLHFDDRRARVTPHVQYYDLSEYIVVWRKNRLELYRNYVCFYPVSLTDYAHRKAAYSRKGIYRRTQAARILDTPAIIYSSISLFFYGFHILLNLSVQPLPYSFVA